MSRPGRGITAVLVALAAAAALSGCASAGTSPSASHVARAVEVSAPGCRLELEEHLRLGRFTLALARAALRIAGEDDGDAAAILSEIHRVEIATYRVHPGTATGLPRSLGELDRVLSVEGMQRVIRTSDSDERSWVLTREDDHGELSELMVVSLDQGELDVVRLQGRIDRLLAKAMEQDPDAAAAILRGSS